VKTFAPLILAAMSLCSCALLPTYVPPKSEGNASLQFRGAFRDSAFTMYTDGSNCSGNATLPKGIDFFKPNARPLVIAANREFAFDFTVFKGGLLCGVLTSFTPRANTSYVADAHSEGYRCSVSIYRKVGFGEQARLVPEPSQKRRTPRASMLPSGSFCKPVPDGP
jgi:hypothetical protein